MNKTCKICLTEKNKSEFYYGTLTCKPCYNKKSIAWTKANPDKVKVSRRKFKLKEKYGISVEEYDKMYAEQNGVCYICHKEHLRRPLNVDHCHKTGKVRKLLCDKCNMALGLLDDSIELLDRLQKYLKEHH
jgi:hypothetical protein